MAARCALASSNAGRVAWIERARKERRVQLRVDTSEPAVVEPDRRVGRRVVRPHEEQISDIAGMPLCEELVHRETRLQVEEAWAVFHHLT
jgi:hypothetical protein